MTLRRCRKAAVWTAVTLGVLFRLVGATVNTQANDDHLEVIRVLAHERRIPAPDEFWEAFQPLLYHSTVALTLIALPELPPRSEITVAQAISCAAGLLTLFVLIRFVRQLRLSEPVADLAIALISLNPALISTSIQATNDAYVIMSVTVGLAAGYRFFRAGERGAFVAMTMSVLLACIAKGNGLVLAIAVTSTFAGALLRGTLPRRTLATYAALLIVAFAMVVPWMGGYLARQTTMGSPFAIAQPPAAPPDFVRETFDKRPGITSVVNGFLTFRIVSMLEDPLIDAETRPPGAEEFPRHRTSMWSLVYGGIHSVHYAYYPKSWRVPRAVAQGLVRVVVVLALLPTLAAMIGVLRGGIDVVRQGLATNLPGEWTANLLLALAAAGYLAFVAVYGYRYRDFATMKGIFVCPAALAFVTWFVRELERQGGQLRAQFIAAASASGWLLCAAYVADVGALMYWLGQQMTF